MTKLQQLQVLFTGRHSPVVMEHKTYLAQEHILQQQVAVTRTFLAEGALVDPDGQPDLFPDVLCLMLRIFRSMLVLLYIHKRYSSPVTVLEWPRRFQEVKVPRFHDNGTEWW